MNRKELYQNVRKAYRLAYEVQDGIVETVEYIHSHIQSVKWGGKQIFSNKIDIQKPSVDDYVNEKFGQGMWSWDYFPTYMYMYYFSMKKPSDHQKCCFSIVQVMDDGFDGCPKNKKPLDTNTFTSPEESHSFLQFAFAIKNTSETDWRMWYNGGAELLVEADEIIRISKEIESKKIVQRKTTSEKTTSEEIKIEDNEKKEAYYIKSDGKGNNFVVMQFSLENIGNREEADAALDRFNEVVVKETRYKLKKRNTGRN